MADIADLADITDDAEAVDVADSVNLVNMFNAAGMVNIGDVLDATGAVKGTQVIFERGIGCLCHIASYNTRCFLMETGVK